MTGPGHNLGRLISDMDLVACDRCSMTECETRPVLLQHGWKFHGTTLGEIVLCKACEPDAFPASEWFGYRPEAA